MNTFQFADQSLRTIDLDETPWFVAADVCRCLGLDLTKGTHKHLGRLGDDEKRIITHAHVVGLRGAGATAVSESGLYKLIMRSDKPEARQFQDWVTREVLPAIRKTGGYLLNEEARAKAHADTCEEMPLPQVFLDALKELGAEMAALREENAALRRDLFDPEWVDKEGAVKRVSEMGTENLHAIIAGDYGDEFVRAAIKRELGKRRSVGAQAKAAEAAAAEAARRAKARSILGLD